MSFNIDDWHKAAGKSYLCSEIVKNKTKQDMKGINMKEEALKLADELLRENTQVSVESAYMIRRLLEELDKQTYKADLLENTLKIIVGSKPLSDEEIVNIWEKANYESKYYEASDNFAIEFARAIEERHGIK